MGTLVTPTVFVADGIGTKEERTSNVVNDAVNEVVRDIPGTEAKWVPWTAGYGPIGGTGKSWDANATAGAQTLVDMIEKSNGPVVLFGYSGGCLVVRKALDRMPDRLRYRVIAVGLLSDPFRPHGNWQRDAMHQPDGSGVCGGREVAGMMSRTYWTTHPLDPIGNAHPDSLLRTLADLTDHLGTDTDAFFRDVMDTLHSRQLQLWRERSRFARNPIHWLQTIGWRVDVSIQEVLDYSSRGYHTRAYNEAWNGGKTLSERLGATVSWKTRKELGLV